MTVWVDAAPKATARSRQILGLLNAAATANPDDVALQRRLAQSLTLGSKTRLATAESALEVWHRVTVLAPHDASAWFEMGKLLVESRASSEAVDALETACRLRPDWAQYHLERARALRALGATEDVEDAYDRAIAADPDHPFCIRAVGRRLLQAGLGKRLAEHCENAAERVGWHTHLLDHRVDAHAFQNESDRVHDWVDYERLVHISQIEPPAPFKSLAEFNAAIVAELYATGLVRSGDEDETSVVRGGNAILGGAVAAAANAHRLAPACTALVEAVKAAYAAYPGATKSEGIFRTLKPASALIVGNGHRTNHADFVRPHTHCGSWLVAVYYLVVPETGTNDNAGCLEYGPPEALKDIPDSLWPRLVIRPVPGKLVLFPGYLCHWTWPNHIGDDRIALSFDFVPAGRQN